MILIVVGVLILFLVVTGSRIVKSDGPNEEWDGPCFAFAILLICLAIAIIIASNLAYEISREKALDFQLEIYLEENEQIEEKTYQVVQKFMEYEQETFEGLTKESSMTLIQLYPDLRSSELIQSLVLIYQENTQQIKALRTRKAELVTYKFWLYFNLF